MTYAKRVTGIRGRSLPITRVGRTDYFVDGRLGQFRTVAPPTHPSDVIDFESERGRHMLAQCASVMRVAGTVSRVWAASRPVRTLGYVVARVGRLTDGGEEGLRT